MKHFMHRCYTVGALAASLAFAGGVWAQDRDHQDRHANEQQRRYEDAAHNDSHEWNEQEDQAYRRYLTEHHKKYHDFAKANKKEQSDYWKWRHEHPDDNRR